MIDISSQTARGTVSKNIVKKYSSFISHLDHGWSPPSCPWQPPEAAAAILGGPDTKISWTGLRARVCCYGVSFGDLALL